MGGADTNNAVLPLTMDQARAVTANFQLDTETLTVASEHGTADPVAGGHVYDYGTVLTNSVSSPDTIGGTQYVSTGWAMTGNEPPSGSSNSFVMTLTNTAALTWVWGTNYAFTATAGANGSVSGSTNGWYALGGSVTVTATPNANYHFSGWTGDVQGGYERAGDDRSRWTRRGQ